MNLQTAYQRVLACQLSYTDEALPIGPSGARVLVIEDAGETYITFRGTDRPRLWFEDLRFVPVQSGIFPGWVHSGFHGLVQGWWNDLLALLPKPDPEDPRKIHVCGHSLGACEAIGAAWRLAARPGYQVESVYLFAPAEFGDAGFRTEFNRRLPANVYTIVHHNDIVPSMPPWWAAGHLGELVYVDAQGALRENYTDRAEHFWQLTWDDHHIAQYVRIIANATARAAAA